MLAGLVMAQQQLRLPAPRSLSNRGSEANPGALTLVKLIESVNRNYPPLRAALLERPLAEADLLNQQGRFDLSLKARSENQRLGFYENERFEIAVEQPTTLWGATVYSGYSVSEGRYPDYSGALITNSGGQYKAGVRVPLGRDRAIDGRRAELSKARAGLRLADLSIDQQRLAILQTATRRYWDWVAAGRRLIIANALLEVASGRDTILKEAVRIGALPAFEQIDNQRIVLQRRNNVVEARRAVENATIELSLFLRDDTGKPALALAEAMPSGFPDPADLPESRILADLDAAFAQRPDLQRYSLLKQQVGIDRKLAENQNLPGIDLFTEYNRELGDGGVKRGPNDVRFGLLFDLPLQRRQAQSRVQAAEARLQQLDRREQFQREQITAEVRDASSAVRAAFERSSLATEELAVTRQVEDAERLRFELGDSTLFFLNQREQSTAEAAVREANTLADYFRSIAIYELAITNSRTPSR